MLSEKLGFDHFDILIYLVLAAECIGWQAVNEESLKQLNEYISQLHSQRRASALKLTFYVRPQTTDEASVALEANGDSGL